MKNKKDFFGIYTDNYNIIYHVPSSKIIKVSRDVDIDNYSDEDLYKNFSQFKKGFDKAKKYEYSKGKPGLIFMTSRTCNLGCKYCYAGEGEYGNVECKPKYIKCELFMKSIEVVLNIYKEGIKSISFFGGEPLLNFKEIKKFVPQCIQYFHEKKLEPPIFSVSTNSTVVDDEMIQFFKEYHIIIVSSLDGTKEINDLARVYKGKVSSVFDKIKEVTKKYNENGIDFHLQMVINKNHIKEYKKGEAINWLKTIENFGFRDLAITPVETDNEELAITSDEDLKKLDMIAREITNYYINKLHIDKKYIGPKGIIAPITQIATNKFKRNCSSGHSLFVDTDGNLYPCQLFCNDDSFQLGNIYAGVIDKNKVEENANIDRFDGEDCQNCIARKICMYWCKGIQNLSKGDMYKVCETRCIFQKAIMEESIKALTELKKGTIKYRNFWDNVYKIYEIKENGE